MISPYTTRKTKRVLPHIILAGHDDPKVIELWKHMEARISVPTYSWFKKSSVRHSKNQTNSVFSEKFLSFLSSVNSRDYFASVSRFFIRIGFIGNMILRFTRKNLSNCCRISMICLDFPEFFFFNNSKNNLCVCK